MMVRFELTRSESTCLAGKRINHFTTSSQSFIFDLSLNKYIFLLFLLFFIFYNIIYMEQQKFTLMDDSAKSLFLSPSFIEKIYNFYMAYINADATVRSNLGRIFNEGEGDFLIDEEEDDIYQIAISSNTKENKLQQLQQLFNETVNYLNNSYFDFYNMVIDASINIQNERFTDEYIAKINNDAEQYKLEGGRRKQNKKRGNPQRGGKKREVRRRSQQKRKSPKKQVMQRIQQKRKSPEKQKRKSSDKRK